MSKRKTAIGYVDYTVNPYLWKCRRKSPGCAHCFMFALAQRYGQNPTDGFGTRWAAAERELANIPAGSRVFLEDMGDTYYELASDEDVIRCHQMAVNRPDLFFCIVTKRPERPYLMGERLPWPDNLWLIVSVETADYLWRIDYALATGARHVGVSAEPLLEDIGIRLRAYVTARGWPWRDAEVPDDVHLAGQHRAAEWIIAGGESGPNRRQFEQRWARSILHTCQEFGVPVFYKQGSSLKPGRDRLLDGRTWDEIPQAFGGTPELGAAVSPPSEQTMQMPLFE